MYIQHVHAVWTRSIDMQHGGMDREHEHEGPALWTFKMEMHDGQAGNAC